MMDNIETTSMNSPKNFQCPVCEKHFSRKFTLDMHLLIHKGLKPHSCSICGRCFRQKGTLMRHKALHSTTALFQCHLCNKAYRQKNVYLHHLKYTHKVLTSASLERKKFSSVMANAENMALTYPQNYLMNESDKSVQDVTLSDSVHLSISAPKAVACLNETDIVSSGRGSFVKKGMDRPKFDKLNSATDSYWRCDFCGIIMKYSYENCTRHVATHKKEFTFQCLGCSSVFLEKTDLLNHHSRCMAYQGQLQIKVPFNLSLDNPSTCYTEPQTNNRNLSDVTFTCIPCQLDFQTEDDFECHVKTHVQSVLGECSNSESSPDLPEAKFNPYSLEQNLPYPGSSGMERAEKVGDPYECGNPYELINTVVAGANSVLNFMSNINNEDLNNSDRAANGYDSSTSLNLRKPDLIIKKQVKSERNSKITAENWGESFNCDKEITIRSKSTILKESPSLKSFSNVNKNSSKLVSNDNIKSTATKNKYMEALSVKLKEKLNNDRKSNLSANDRSQECQKEISHIKYFYCKICKMKFKSRFQRQVHFTKHIELMSIKCTLCNKIFLHKFQLLQHLRQTHSKKFSCPNSFCQKCFTNKNLFELHKKTCKVEAIPSFRNLAFAPVIDLTKLNSENEGLILGVIPLNDKRNEIHIKKEFSPKIRYGIPVLTLESTKKGCRGLPIIGEISLLK